MNIRLNRLVPAALLLAALIGISSCGFTAEEPTEATTTEAAVTSTTEATLPPTTTPPEPVMVDFYNDFRPDTFVLPVFDEAALLEERLFFEVDGLWGVMDGRGNTIVEPVYGKCAFVGDNEIILCLSDDYDLYTNIRKISAVMDRDGNPVDFPGYDSLYSALFDGYRGMWYYVDYIIAEKNGLQGVIDLSGNVIVPIKYSKVEISEWPFGSQIAHVWSGDKQGAWHMEYGRFADAKYDRIRDIFYSSDGIDYFHAEADGEYGLYDLKGKRVLALEPDDGVIAAEDGYFIFRDSQYIWLDSDLNVLCTVPDGAWLSISYGYYTMVNFIGPYALLNEDSGQALLASSGEIVLRGDYITWDYDYSEDYSAIIDTRIVVTRDDLDSYYSLDLQLLDYTPPEQVSSPNTSNIWKETDEYNIINSSTLNGSSCIPRYDITDKQGNVLMSIPCDYLNVYNDGDYFIPFINPTWGQRFRGATILDRDLNPVFDDEVEIDVQYLDWDGERFFIVRHDGKCRAYSEDGLKHLTRELFDDIKLGSYGIITVQRGGKWAFIDAQGNYLTGFDFDDAGVMNSNGFAAVRVGGLWGSIDISGGWSAEPYLPADAQNISHWKAENLNFIGRYFYLDDYVDSRYTYSTDPILHYAA